MVFYHLVLSTKQHSSYEPGFNIGEGSRKQQSATKQSRYVDKRSSQEVESNYRRHRDLRRRRKRQYHAEERAAQTSLTNF